jgi:hypothetical protein
MQAGSMGQAAQRLDISQPAISTSIAEPAHIRIWPHSAALDFLDVPAVWGRP